LLGLDARRTVMKTPVTEPAFTASAHGLFAGDGTPVTVIRDSAGFVAQRILAMIVHIGCSISQSGAATPEDIDKAVTLGLGYPHGPLAFGDFLGAGRVLEILISIFETTGDPRYRPTPWLRRRALLGKSLLTPEN
ncbi:MAG TPA: 3-hydroxyacyl-CoA dehydrogenase, partial [Rhizobiales bacterium]|nr:3-hydroxyacyl-CoA dehydrogenase [Hyphomicrobiales bacterium]